MTDPSTITTEQGLVDYYLEAGVTLELAAIMAAQRFGTFEGDAIEVSDDEQAAIIAEQDGATPPA